MSGSCFYKWLFRAFENRSPGPWKYCCFQSPSPEISVNYRVFYKTLHTFISRCSCAGDGNEMGQNVRTYVMLIKPTFRLLPGSNYTQHQPRYLEPRLLELFSFPLGVWVSGFYYTYNISSSLLPRRTCVKPCRLMIPSVVYLRDKMFLGGNFMNGLYSTLASL